MQRILFLIIISAIVFGCHSETGVQITEGHYVTAKHCIVASAHQESSRVGVALLQKGGNAIDAAVATEFALAVCHPEAGNLGGGGFMVIRMKDGNTDFIDYREKAPLSSSTDMFLGTDREVTTGLSTETHLASGVPGTVDGMIKIHTRYGKLAFRDIIQPAIDLAENGFKLKKNQAESLNRNRDNFIRKNKSKTAFVKESEWKEGDVLIQPELAETLKRIRDNGREGFYSGRTAQLIIEEMKSGNGIISDQDLKEYNAVFRKPLIHDYKGFRMISAPPPSGGGLILFQILGMVEPYPLKDWGFHSVKSIHLIAEAERRAFADRAEYYGDPDFVDVPVNGLLNRGYLTRKMSDFNENIASLSSDINAGYPAGYESEETTHYSVVDPFGNAVAATTTLNGWYGSSIVVDGAGFILNNEMDDFSAKTGVPNISGLTGRDANSIKPGKRMLSSMTPTIVEKDGKLFLIAGSPGSSTIPTTVLQIILNVIDYDMNIRQAVDTGRFHHQWLPDMISYENSRFDTLTIQKLRALGHNSRLVSGLGRVNAIQILQYGELAGAADKRGDNSACGY